MNLDMAQLPVKQYALISWRYIESRVLQCLQWKSLRNFLQPRNERSEATSQGHSLFNSLHEASHNNSRLIRAYETANAAFTAPQTTKASLGNLWKLFHCRCSFCWRLMFLIIRICSVHIYNTIHEGLLRNIFFKCDSYECNITSL